MLRSLHRKCGDELQSGVNMLVRVYIAQNVRSRSEIRRPTPLKNSVVSIVLEDMPTFQHFELQKSISCWTHLGAITYEWSGYGATCICSYSGLSQHQSWRSKSGRPWSTVKEAGMWIVMPKRFLTMDALGNRLITVFLSEPYMIKLTTWLTINCTRVHRPTQPLPNNHWR